MSQNVAFCKHLMGWEALVRQFQVAILAVGLTYYIGVNLTQKMGIGFLVKKKKKDIFMLIVSKKMVKKGPKPTHEK